MVLKIYLGDLTHDGTGNYATDLIPYNIGLIASYAKAELGDKVEIRLFKYAEKLIDALKESPPDILGLSNYCWNANQSEWICQIAKEIRPNIITVKGGTNYPFDAHNQKLFFQQFKFTDFHIFYEGEVAFVNFCKAYLSEQKLANNFLVCKCSKTCFRIIMSYLSFKFIFFFCYWIFFNKFEFIF